MIDTIITLFLNSYTYIRKHPQIILTLLLIVVIPISFLLSGQQFLNVAQENQEGLEKERVGLLHDILLSVIQMPGFDTVKLQDLVLNIASRNPDITEFDVVREVNDEYHIVASLDGSRIGTIDENASKYTSSAIDSERMRTILVQKIENGTRYWEASRHVQIKGGDDYYLFTKTSLAHIDNLFADRIVTAYYWLLAILAVILFLIVRHVRLIDYAYLYSETKKTNEMKDLFTNMVAHELRAPLTAMRGYASMIREYFGLEDDIRVHASRIEDASTRLLLIVSDLLDVARIHSGKLAVQNKRCDIQTTISSVLEMMQIPAQEKNITLTRDGMKGELYMNIDEKRLYQAFTNLVSNSIKYTKAGSIVVGIEERSDRVEIRVKDTGMGIRAEDQKNLFAPFFRVENIEMDQTVGTGLGMWITKQLIELMKGSIAVESIRGVGTHIIVTLPK